jgi:hypothetical protein
MSRELLLEVAITSGGPQNKFVLQENASLFLQQCLLGMKLLIA